jgi:hypothetical protein
MKAVPSQHGTLDAKSVVKKIKEHSISLNTNDCFFKYGSELLFPPPLDIRVLDRSFEAFFATLRGYFLC